jgi:DNA-binding GntR family transcriptional regulator
MMAVIRVVTPLPEIRYVAEIRDLYRCGVRADEPGRSQQVSLVRDLLREHLLRTGGRRGRRLPQEYTLTRELGCSRNVLREALGLLVADGLIRRERGRGTHVLTTSPATSIDQGMDLWSAIRTEIVPSPRRSAVSYRVLAASPVRASGVLADLLGVTPGTMVAHVERLVLLEGSRVGHWDLHITGVARPVEQAPEIAALAGGLMAEPLLRALRLDPDHEEVRVEAITPSPRTASLLYRGSVDKPTLRVSRRFRDARGRTLALAIGRCALPGAAFSVIRQCARALPLSLPCCRHAGARIAAGSFSDPDAGAPLPSREPIR